MAQKSDQNSHSKGSSTRFGVRLKGYQGLNLDPDIRDPGEVQRGSLNLPLCFPSADCWGTGTTGAVCVGSRVLQSAPNPHPGLPLPLLFVVFPILLFPPKEKKKIIAFSEILLGFHIQGSNPVPARGSCVGSGGSDQPAAALQLPRFITNHVLNGFIAAVLLVSLQTVSIERGFALLLNLGFTWILTWSLLLPQAPFSGATLYGVPARAVCWWEVSSGLQVKPRIRLDIAKRVNGAGAG